MSMTRALDGRTAEIGSAQKILFELQVEQHHHDEVYHREIARLSLHQRLNHMALHFAKYTGRIAAAENMEGVVPQYVDTLIIALSTANILNIEIWDVLEHEGCEYPGLLAFARTLAQRLNETIQDQSSLLRETSIAAGRVAAACEKIDHLEEISFRSEITQGVARLVTLALAVVAANGIDPAHAVQTRLAKVKERLRLHGRV
jgi:hypothetical protein